MGIQFLPMVALLVTLAICLAANVIGRAFGVMAVPDGRRRTHQSATPQLGGVAILCGFGIWIIGAMFLGDGRDIPLLRSLLLAGGGLAVVGFVDDKHEIPPAPRVLLLLAFTGIAFTLNTEMIAPALHWYSFGDVPIAVWAFLALMSITAVGLVNSVNMADGQNGLVGSMFVAWSICLAIVTDGTLQSAAIVLCALSGMFLIFNLQGRMFLGDCGSYGVTFAIGLMATLAHARGDVPLETIIVWFFIPVVDCLRLMIARPLQKRSIFEGARDHFHHRLIESMGMRISALVYGGVVFLSSLGATLEPRFALVILCLLCGFYFSFARLSEGEIAESAVLPEEDAKVVGIRDTKRHP